MKRIPAALLLVIILASPVWAGQCAIPPGGQCSLVMDPKPAPVEVVNLDQSKSASVLGFWLYSVQLDPRRVSAGLGPGEAAVFSPTQAKDGQGNAFAARTLVIFNIGTANLSARTVK
ncbi:MAG: hypothetical protein K9K65_11880 [Desulfarculaceae bacterium]|nr:hypothetical protein [Desulfarculaceae bacterium]MCF8098533.1 hypothetical protein [Desulfarculaceae bacterium]MCF8123953.1 hypothetical protein [Desulfarculaceae bacterium]